MFFCKTAFTRERRVLSLFNPLPKAPLNFFPACIPLLHPCSYRVTYASNPNSTEMPATFQPGLSDKVIQGSQCGSRSYFQMHPIHGQAVSLHDQMQCLVFFAF